MVAGSGQPFVLMFEMMVEVVLVADCSYSPFVDFVVSIFVCTPCVSFLPDRHCGVVQNDPILCIVPLYERSNCPEEW